MKWFVSGLISIVFLIAALIILAPTMSPITNITYTYSDGSAKFIEYVDFDMRVPGIPVLWVNDNAILCEVIGTTHAHCNAGGIPAAEVESIRAQIIDR